jgi:hypothetical protein
MKFNKEVLADVAYDDCPDGFEKVEDTIVETTRWAILHSMVFKFEDKFYRSLYRKGATEMQDEQPYEYDGDGEGMVECAEVIQVEKTVKVWVDK